MYYNYIYNKLLVYVLPSLVNCVLLKKGNPLRNIISRIEEMLKNV